MDCKKLQEKIRSVGEKIKMLENQSDKKHVDDLRQKYIIKHLMYGDLFTIKCWYRPTN